MASVENHNDPTASEPNDCVPENKNLDVDGDDSKNNFDDENVYTTLNWIKANLDQLAENCRSINERINLLEMDCIDLLQPMGDIISLERELKRLNEIESNYMNTLKKQRK